MRANLEALGINVDLDDGDLIASAVLITKIVKEDGSVVVGICDSDGMSWVEQLGLLAAAQQIIHSVGRFEEDE
ncbi:hypothetical protein GCM10009602_70560 [Nocardiopsis tropica]